jgi:hypothetical protein
MENLDETSIEYEEFENQPLKEPIRPRPPCAVRRGRREQSRGRPWLRNGAGRGIRRGGNTGAASGSCRAGKGNRHA